jgi:hypothetical protein
MAVDIQEVLIADSQFGGGATTWAPATWYCGLSTTVPNDDGSNFTEPSGFAYARAAIVNNVTNWPGATTVAGITTKVNGTVINFPNPTGLWGTLIYWGLFIASTSGVVRYFNPLDTPVTPQNGNTPVQIPAGTLILPWD